jgi:hypothetical protein
MALSPLVGCSEGVDTGSGPTLVILSPADGSTICGAPLRVEVAVSGMVLADPYAPVAEPGTGHLDVALNGQEVLMTDQLSFEVEDVGDGTWQLLVELSNADHTPVDPYVADTVTLTTAASACR